MELSFKDIKFLLEGREHLLEIYNQRSEAKQYLPEAEDEIADLEALLTDLEKYLSDKNYPQVWQ